MLEEVGVAFPENPGALARWREAGADVEGDRVRLPRGLARQLCATAPSGFTQVARNPERSVRIARDTLVLAPVYGPPFWRDENGRRYATIADFRDLVRLGAMSPWLHHSGGTLCEPTDVPVPERHLDMLLAHATLGDKPFMGAVTDPSRARDSVEFCEVLFGGLEGRTALTSLINVNSPLTFDATMAGALEVYAAANQACIVSPFIVGGAMAPVTVAGTLVQVLAEVLAGVAYTQLVRPGAPAIFGAFVTSIDMRSGAPTFGAPEAAQILMGAGQLARRMSLPFRSGGALTGSKVPDAQAAYESANTLNAALMGGVNFMLHSCGWLEGGLVASPEKFVMDADQLGALSRLAGGIDASEDGPRPRRDPRGRAGRALPRLRPHAGAPRGRLLAQRRPRPPDLRELAGGRRARHRRARARPGQAAPGRARGPAPRSRRGRGARRLPRAPPRRSARLSLSRTRPRRGPRPSARPAPRHAWRSCRRPSPRGGARRAPPRAPSAP